MLDTFATLIEKATSTVFDAVKRRIRYVIALSEIND